MTNPSRVHVLTRISTEFPFFVRINKRHSIAAVNTSEQNHFVNADIFDIGPALDGDDIAGGCPFDCRIYTVKFGSLRSNPMFGCHYCGNTRDTENEQNDKD